jgi:CRISPR-associated protein Cst1
MRYTGHPFVDAGAAAISAWRGLRRPDELVADDLATWAQMSVRLYRSPVGDLALNQLFTRNFPFLHPSMSAERRRTETERVLFAWRDAPVGRERCAYCHEPALAQRVHRDRVPLLEGRDRLNFGPGGRGGLAVCGECLLALQALAIACPVARGRVVVLETPDDDLRLAVYGLWVRDGVERAERSLLTGERLAKRVTPLTVAVSALAQRLHQSLLINGETQGW